MFDYMIKVLNNNRLLVRENASGATKNLKATEISSFFENVLEEQLEAQDKEDAKIAEIKKQLKVSNE